MLIQYDSNDSHLVVTTTGRMGPLALLPTEYSDPEFEVSNELFYKEERGSQKGQPSFRSLFLPAVPDCIRTTYKLGLGL